MKVNLPILLTLLLYIQTYSQKSNIISYGIDSTDLSAEHHNLNTYRSTINFPPFIGWSRNGKKMLFNGGKVIYAMKRYNSEIKEYEKFDSYLSSYLSPDRRKFLYLEDDDGNEDYQIFLFDIKTNKAIEISAKGDKSYDPFWSPDSNRFAYKSNKRNATEVDLYFKSLTNLDNENLVFQDFSDDGQLYDWSAEKGLVLAAKVISENNKMLYLINDVSGHSTQINSTKSNIAYSDAKFIPNQEACLIVSDEFSEFLELTYYDLNQKRFNRITSDIPWDVEALTIDEYGEIAAFSTNENGFSKLYILDLKTLAYQKVADFPIGILDNLVIANNGTKIGFNFYSSTFSRKVFCYDIKNKTLKQYARKGKLPVDAMTFATAEPFTFKSVDTSTGIENTIPAFIYKPQGSARPSPVFIDIHGGPEYQIRPRFNSFYQYLVNELGITVIIPNIRGSNGYGKSYMKADDTWNRENAIADVGALLDWIKNEKNLDEKNVSIYGESYGGYVVLASLAKYPQRLKCGIDIVGISNWVSYLENTRDYRRDLRRVEFGDERIESMRNFLSEISPLTNVQRIDSPLLIVQGFNDPRVNYKESVQMFESLNKKNKDVWFLMAKDEGHGFHKRQNYKLQQNLVVSFLKKHLLNSYFKN